MCTEPQVIVVGSRALTNVNESIDQSESPIQQGRLLSGTLPYLTLTYLRGMPSIQYSYIRN